MFYLLVNWNPLLPPLHQRTPIMIYFMYIICKAEKKKSENSQRDKQFCFKLWTNQLIYFMFLSLHLLQEHRPAAPSRGSWRRLLDAAPLLLPHSWQPELLHSLGLLCQWWDLKRWGDRLTNIYNFYIRSRNDDGAIVRTALRAFKH